MAARLRSGVPLLRRALTAGNLSSAERSVSAKSVLCPSISCYEVYFNCLSPTFYGVSQGRKKCARARTLTPTPLAYSARNYSSSAPAKEQKVKVPVTMFGVSGNYASALYIAAVKANVLDKVESELLSLVEASKKSPTFSQFMKDLSVDTDTRVKALTDICSQAKFSDITKNFLVIVAESGRLGHVERMAQRFSELTMAHRGEVKVRVTSVIPLPAEEEKELKESLQHVLGKGKNIHVEQKVDPNILGGIIVEFGQKVLDMSIRTRAAQMERFLRQPLTM